MAEQLFNGPVATVAIAGVVTTVVSGMPVGLGEPCFDKLEAGARRGSRTPGTDGWPRAVGPFVLEKAHRKKTGITKSQRGSETDK